MQVVLNNIILNYLKEGNEQSQPILVLHGWGHSSKDWVQVSKILATEYFVISLDLPGFGQSEEPPSDWGIFEYSDLVNQFIVKNFKRPPIIIGHSFGGRIATILSGMKAVPIKHTILIDSGGIEIKSILVRIKILTYKYFIKPLRKIGPKSLLSGFSSSDYSTASPVMRKVLSKTVNTDLRDIIKNLARPLTIIWGNKDAVLPVRYTKIYKSLVPHSRIIIIWGSGHNPHITHTHELCIAILESLKSYASHN